MGDDPLVLCIQTAFPGYCSKQHHLLFALKGLRRLLFMFQADVDLRPGERYTSSGAANWAHTSRSHEDVSPGTTSSSDGGASALKRSDLEVNDAG